MTKEEIVNKIVETLDLYNPIYISSSCDISVNSSLYDITRSINASNKLIENTLVPRMNDYNNPVNLVSTIIDVIEEYHKIKYGQKIEAIINES